MRLFVFSAHSFNPFKTIGSGTRSRSVSCPTGIVPFPFVPRRDERGPGLLARDRFLTQSRSIASSVYSKKYFNIVYIGTTQFGGILRLTITNVA